MRPILLCLVLLAACSKHNSGPRYTSDSVIGRWRMIAASGGILGTVFPDLRDSAYILQLNADSTWQTSMHGRFLGSGTFSDTTVTFDNIPSPALVLKPFGRPQLFKVNGDTLRLADLFIDGYSAAYLRSPDGN